jgi:Domain of unknown function (DUF222)
MSLAQISELVDELEISVDGAEIGRAIAIRDRFDARIAVSVGEFDAADLFDLDGDLTMQTWLRHHTRQAPVTAARETVRGRKLRRLPVLRDAVLAGRMSGGQLDVIVTQLPMRHVDLFADHERGMLRAWEALSIEDTAKAMTAWLARADALDPGQAPVEHDNEVRLVDTIDQRGDLRGSLDADLNALVKTAFEVADCGDFELTVAQRQAQSLGDICAHYLDNHTSNRARRHRPHVNVVMTYEQFVGGRLGGAYLHTGGPVSPHEAAALACDAAVRRIVVEGRSTILDYGRMVRTAPAELYNVLLARDRGCRWPGCDRPGSHCDAHHVVWFEHGGRTGVDNLVLLCRRHHRKLHRHSDWRAKLLPDGTLEITDPRGRVETSVPPGPIPQQFWRTPDGG